jgi:RNA polymerase sigma factor (sigma-70 family)
MLDNELELIEGCRQNNRKSQERLYKKYAGLMLGICFRYVKNRQEAEDVMMEGFMKIFKAIPNFVLSGSFEGWMKRIMVYTAIEHYRKLAKMPFDEFEAQDAMVDDHVIDSMSARDILNLMHDMPEGYRVVFNMFAIEGYSHKEIANTLGISEGTSKSQFNRSKAYLKKLIEKKFIIHSKS